ncbi:unnamed protein product [Musa hybrid cultivar]
MDPDAEVERDLSPFLRIYKSGRVERLLGTEVLPAGTDPATGVASKDVLFDPDAGLWVRLYLLDLAGCTPDKRLPVVVYFHGGSFTVETAASSTYHNYLNSLVAAACVLGVSVNFRRPPEHPLPAAYDDSLAAVRWVTETGEAWVAERGDLGRVFLAGDSAGGNIAHQVALRAGAEVLGGGAVIKGLVLIHPFFWGAEPLGSEDPVFDERIDSVWRLLCPGASGLDDPRVNPLAELAPSLGALPCRRELVAVAEKDRLRERSLAYYEALRRSGWDGEALLLESEGEQHVFHLHNPHSDKARAKLRAVVDFLTAE